MSNNGEYGGFHEEVARILRQTRNTQPNPRPKGNLERFTPIAAGLIGLISAGVLGMGVDKYLLHGWEQQHFPFSPFSVIGVDGALPGYGLYRLTRAAVRR